MNNRSYVEVWINEIGDRFLNSQQDLNGVHIKLDLQRTMIYSMEFTLWSP